MLMIAIDGACRRNGQPTCVAAGGVFVQQFDENLELIQTRTFSIHEVGSTSQRGELLALLITLDYIHGAGTEAMIVTDSEYLFNAMTKRWPDNWERKGWLTAMGEPVKNKDLWLEIIHAYRRCEEDGVEIMFYHIKGHCIPFGAVTAKRLMERDETGTELLLAIMAKYDEVQYLKADKLEHAQILSVKNNGFYLTPEKLKHFVTANLVADTVATHRVDAADQ